MSKNHGSKLTRVTYFLSRHRRLNHSKPLSRNAATSPPQTPSSNCYPSDSQLSCPPRAPGTDEMTFPHAIVRKKYIAKQPNELTAHKYELIVLLHRTDENWYYACNMDRTKVGFIPRNFIDIRIDIAKSSNSQSPNAGPEIPSWPVETKIPQMQNIKKPLKLRQSSDVFLKVIQDFESEADGDLSAKQDEIILWVDKEAEKGRPIPQDWITCMNLSGKVGTFPGNIVVALNSDDEIDEALTKSPHGVSVKQFNPSEDGLVSVEFGEAIFIDQIIGGFIQGRTASGQVGKIPLEICNVAELK